MCIIFMSNCVQQLTCRQKLLMSSSVKNLAVVYMSMFLMGPFMIAQLLSVSTSISLNGGHALTRQTPVSRTLLSTGFGKIIFTSGKTIK